MRPAPRTRTGLRSPTDNARGAREELMLILQIDPGHHDARTLLGVIEIETGDPDRGKEHLRAVVDQRADHPVAGAYLEKSDPSFRRAS